MRKTFGKVSFMLSVIASLFLSFLYENPKAYTGRSAQLKSFLV